MPLDKNNPQAINCLLQSYEKENLLRMKWLKLHEGQINKAATFTREVKNYTENDISKFLMTAGMPSTTRDHAESARYRLVVPAVDYMRPIVSTVKPAETPMKPVEAAERKLLESSGRVKYLKERWKKAPAEKFHFVDCESWQYGWKLNESEARMWRPVHGRVCHMCQSLQSLVGSQPDPEHYASPDSERYCE